MSVRAVIFYVSRFFLLLKIFLILNWGHFHLLLLRKWEKEREKHQCDRSIHWLPLYAPRLEIHAGTRDPMCSDWGLDAPAPGPGMNPKPRYVPWLGIKPSSLGLQDNAPTTEPTQARVRFFFKYWEKFSISNNHASDKPHWLQYCHCAKLTFFSK